MKVRGSLNNNANAYSATIFEDNGKIIVAKRPTTPVGATDIKTFTFNSVKDLKSWIDKQDWIDKKKVRIGEFRSSKLKAPKFKAPKMKQAKVNNATLSKWAKGRC